MNKARLARIEKVLGVSDGPLSPIAFQVGENGKVNVAGRDFATCEEAERVLSAEEGHEVRLYLMQFVVNDGKSGKGKQHEQSAGETGRADTEEGTSNYAAQGEDDLLHAGRGQC